MLVNPRRVAMTLSGVSRPVAGLSGVGIPSITMVKRVEVASTVIVCLLRG